MNKKISTLLGLAAASMVAMSNSAISMAQPNLDNNNLGPGTLTIVPGVVGGKTPKEDQLFVHEIKRLTGLDVQFSHVTDLMAAMGSGQKYDLIYLDQPTVDQLVAQGALKPLTTMIKSSKVLSDPKVVPPSEWDYMRSADGQIYVVPVKFEGGRLPIVREDWMKELGLKQPKTLNDFYHVFQVFKQKKHAYGLTLSGLYDIQPFMSAVGLPDGYVVGKDGKKTIPWATSAAVPVYQWLNKLYKEGLLDPKFVTNHTSDERNEFLSNQAGMFVYWAAWVGMLNNLALQNDKHTKFDAEGIPGAVGPNGQILLAHGAPSVWAIPANAPNPALAFKFAEWWNTQPGEILGSLGIKGVNYTVSYKGNYLLTPLGKDENMDHGDPFPMSSYWKNPVGFYPGYQNAANLVNKYGVLAKTDANWSDAQKIETYYGEKAIMGQMPAAAAVDAMHQELLAKHYIDK